MALIAERGIQAVVFDLDGTLIDSHASVERSWERLAEAMGIDYAAAPFTHGVPALANIHAVLPGVDEQTAAHWFDVHWRMECEDTEGVVALPGAHDLLTALDEAQVPWGIATGCSHGLGEARQAAAGIARPEVFVMFGDYTQGKPHPEPFLLAAERLGVSANAVVVVEDAPSGVAAGVAAGAFVVAVSETHSREELRAAHVVVADLHELRTLLLGS